MLVQLSRSSGIPGSVTVSDPSYTAAWTTTFKEPLLVPAESVVGLQGAAVSSILNSALTIRLEHAITMHCTFIVWVPLIDNKVVSTYYAAARNPAGQTSTPMWLRSDPIPSSGVPGGDIFPRHTTFTVPSGFYTPQGLAQKVTEVTSGIITTNGSGGQLASPFSILVNSSTDIGKFWLESSEALGMVGAVLDYANNGGILICRSSAAPQGS
jgi:hypothetical protein